jgi:UDP-GlcNAc:undecaprenyl-phosphate GlcNAc-1-phosphate transferase
VELIVALAVTAIATPVVARLAVRLDIVDRPGPLKVQTVPVPYLGGIAILAGVAGPLAATRPVLALPLCLAAGLGLVDDIHDLGLRPRLATELAIGVLTAVAVDVPVLLIPAVVVITVVLINAVNLLDGLDGLASATVLVAAVGFAVVLDGDFAALALALVGALAGFLLWNRPRARIYLGDAGSYLLGAALAVLCAATLRDGEPFSSFAAALLLVGVPVGDTAVAVLRRWRAKQPLLKGDRGHVYDQLVTRSWSPLRATVACVLAQSVLVVVAIVVAELSSATALVVSGATIAAVGAWSIITFTSPATWR